MIPGSSLDALAARWAARPEPGVFAALAEGLAKRGDLAEAARVVAAGLARYPGHAAGLVAQARIAVAQGDRPLAVRALAVLLERDPGHPLAREMAADLAPELLATPDEPAVAIVSAEPVPADPAGEDAPAASPEATAAPAPEPPGEPLTALDPPQEGARGEEQDPEDEPAAEGVEFGLPEELEAPPIVTESLAALYHQQGHLEEAMAAYAELAARDPSNDTIASRHESLRRELAARRPLPFDARQSGGRGVAAWLGTIAAARPAGRAEDSALDAFYQPPPAPADATADFDAFQRWLEELAR